MVFAEISANLIQFISEHGVIAVILGMVVEEVFVPIPSPVIPMAAGALLVESSSIISAAFEILFLIALPASIASVVSSYFVYGIAYWGGKPVVKNYGRWIDLKWENIQHLEKHFDSGKEKYYVALFRAIPIFPLSLISGSAGLFRMDWKQYGLWSFIGMVPRNFGLAMIGWWAKDGFKSLASQIDTLSTWLMILVIGIVIGYILYHKLEDLIHWLLTQI